MSTISTMRVEDCGEQPQRDGNRLGGIGAICKLERPRAKQIAYNERLGITTKGVQKFKGSAKLFGVVASTDV